MSTLFRIQHQKWKFLFPAFKFLSHEHARKLIDHGNVHVPQLIDFQSDEQHGGTVLDKEEATVTIKNRYTHFEGLAKDANGTLPLLYPPYAKLSLVDQQITKMITFENAYGYCITQHFFTNSVLRWAADRKKETCVLITDVEKFISLVDPYMVALQTQFIDARQCVYIGRTIDEINPKADSLSNFLLANPSTVCFVKPNTDEYRDHREIRAVWLHQGERPFPQNLNFDVPEVRELCIPIDYSAIREFIDRGDKPRSFGARIHRKDGGPFPEFQIGTPDEVCSPVMWAENTDEWQLGFRVPPEVQRTSRSHIRHAETCMIFFGSPIGTVVCHVPFNDIRHIEFFCV